MTHQFAGAGGSVGQFYSIHTNIYDSSLEYVLGRYGLLIKLHFSASCINIPLLAYTHKEVMIMNLIVGRQGFWFRGDMKELLSLLADYPPETTLADFLRWRLH
jgi:hypothetical protein